MLLVFNKDLEITEILKKSSKEGKTYLSKFSVIKPLFKEMDFCPIIMRFEDEKDYYLDEDILQVKKGKSFLLEFDLPDKNEPFFLRRLKVPWVSLPLVSAALFLPGPLPKQKKAAAAHAAS